MKVAPNNMNYPVSLIIIIVVIVFTAVTNTDSRSLPNNLGGRRCSTTSTTSTTTNDDRRSCKCSLQNNGGEIVCCHVQDERDIRTDCKYVDQITFPNGTDISRGKSLLESWVTTFLLYLQPSLIFL